MQSKLYVSGLSLNLLRQTKPIFLSLICMQRNWSSNGLEAAQDERTGDEWSVYRQVQDFRERGSGLRARHLPWQSARWRLIFSQWWPTSCPWSALDQCQSSHWQLQFRTLVPTLVSVAFKIFRQRTPKGIIWSSFAEGENLSSGSPNPEVRD